MGEKIEINSMVKGQTCSAFEQKKNEKETVRATSDPNVKLSFLEKFGYGIGDYAGNLVYSAISAFLLIYYTNVVGVSAVTAASIIAFSKLLDGVSDLVMGHIVDHTHSKWGKARPWILRLALPLAISTVLMFSVPGNLSGNVQLVYMFLTYNLVSTVFYTGINIPYATLNGLMTTNQYERGLLGNFRMLLATAGTMTINTVVLKLTGIFGGGNTYSQKGWTITFIILMLVFVILNSLVFILCKERVVEEHTQDDKQSVSFFKGLKGLLCNKYWILLVICFFVMYFMMSCFYGSAVYFSQYILGDASYYTPISNYLSLAQIITMFLTPFIMKKITKRNLFLVGMSISFLGFLLTGFTSSIGIICVLSVVKGIGFGCGAATMFGMLQDAITYGQWHNGFGNAGMGNAASSFTMKVGSGFGTAALGWILAAGSFNASNAVQSASANTAIIWSFIWVPCIAMLIAVIALTLFDLDKKYDKILEDLSNGKHRGENIA